MVPELEQQHLLLLLLAGGCIRFWVCGPLLAVSTAEDPRGLREIESGWRRLQNNNSQRFAERKGRKLSHPEFLPEGSQWVCSSFRSC